MPNDMEHSLSIYNWPVDELSFSEYINEKLCVSPPPFFFGPREIPSLPVNQVLMLQGTYGKPKLETISYSNHS